MKNIAICLNIEEKSFEALKKIESLTSLENSKITLVHTWNRDAYSYPGDMIVPFYPNDDQANAIEAGIRNELSRQLKKLPQSSSSEHGILVFSSSSPKSDVVKFLEQDKIDLVVCLTPKKSGLKNFFHSSFTNYLNSHAPCDVLALRI